MGKVHKSDILRNNNRVAQNSILGPVLFMLYINDLPFYLFWSKALMNADDTTLILSNKDHNSLEIKYFIGRNQNI